MVILFSIDGMRPDGLQQANSPRIDRLIANGASTMTAQTVMPCCTLPCHTSMLRGVDTPRHGITTNTFHPLVRPVPSILDWATSHGKRCGMFFNWGPLRDLCDPESIVASYFYKGCAIPQGDEKVAEAAVKSLRQDDLDLAFVYFGYTDECGHANGWMSDPYIKAIEAADHCVGQVLDAAPGATAVLLSDHGGHERTHGTEAPEDMTIPWIVSGPGAKQAHKIETSVIIYNTAPTVAALLGLPMAREWDGRPIAEALS